jgi:hypothetical protein
MFHHFELKVALSRFPCINTVSVSYPLEKIVPGDFHETHTNLLVIINLAISMDENTCRHLNMIPQTFCLIYRDRATIDENTPLLLTNRSKSAKNRSHLGVTHGLELFSGGEYYFFQRVVSTFSETEKESWQEVLGDL